MQDLQRFSWIPELLEALAHDCSWVSGRCGRGWV
jgi:hypothetical protein